MRRAALALALLAGGCGNLDLTNGSLPCSTDKRCPAGYYCASDNHCWETGSGPDGGVTDGALPSVDGAGPIADGGADLAGDMTLPFTEVPPATFWMCSGGGGGSSGDGSYELNFSIGGSLRGDGAGTMGDGVSFGFMSTIEQ